MRISVIAWDGGFRELFHTVNAFATQSFSDRYEFIWVEYHADVKPELRKEVSRLDEGRIICLRGEGQWHVGECLNEGIRQSRGEVLVVCDGDIVVSPDFLDTVWEAHERYCDLVLYFRRRDEPESEHKVPVRLGHLRQVCQLRNPTNYGGCLTIRPEGLEYVKGYEIHPVFGGAGAINKELYIRLKNAGFPIAWHPDAEVYHPWHPFTSGGGSDQEHMLKLAKQNWVIRCRDMAVDHLASAEKVQAYLDTFPEPTEHGGRGRPSLVRRARAFLRTVAGRR
jgi:hypothetical protein